MTTAINISELMSLCVDEKLKGAKAAAAKALPNFYCVVRFNDISKASLFHDLAKPLLGEFIHNEEYLFKWCETFDAANKLTNEINSLLYNYKQRLIEQPFESDWLIDYLERYQFGIDIVMTSNVGIKQENIADYIATSRTDHKSSREYHDKKDLAVKAALFTTGADIEKSFSDFLIANWTGFGSDDRVIYLVNKMMSCAEFFTKGRFQLPNHFCQDVIFAIKDKAAYLEGTGVTPKNDRNLQVDWHNLIRDHVEQSDLHGTWENLTKSLKKIIKDEANKIAPQGFDLLLEDEDLNSGAIIPFKGIDLSFDFTYDINRRLSAGNLRYDVQEQGHSLVSMLAGAFAAYYLKVCELKQVGRLRTGLFEYASSMDMRYTLDEVKNVFRNCLN